MGDTLAASVRMGILMIILAACIVSTTTLFAVVNNVYVGYAEKMSDSVSESGSSALAALNQVHRVPARVVYRILYQNIDWGDSLSIRWGDGVITSDYRTLLKKADSFVSVVVKNKGNGVSMVEVTELVD